jgi:2-C-methyl-D-erythritol 2,4-cyclodiphosphate synthase|tara:strand:+ start:12700 stop:13173 length:474 start_codon:yes stop_codon:yes gene_type:complete
MVKTGIGYDVHQLKEGETLIIGGVKIPHEKGPVGHSDGDVLSHAVVDALLGAANLGDIGQYFPSADESLKGASSLTFLTRVAEEVRGKGIDIQHIDCTVVLQKPEILSFISRIKTAMSDALSIDVEKISVKATTTDHLGHIGKGEGISAFSIATISN